MGRTAFDTRQSVVKNASLYCARCSNVDSSWPVGHYWKQYSKPDNILSKTYLCAVCSSSVASSWSVCHYWKQHLKPDDTLSKKFNVLRKTHEPNWDDWWAGQQLKPDIYIVKNASLCSVQRPSLIMTRRPLLKRTKVLRKIHNSFPAKPLLNNRANMMDYAYKSRNETASLVWPHF